MGCFSGWQWHGKDKGSTKDIFGGVQDVEEPIVVLVLGIDGREEGRRGGKEPVFHSQEEGLFRIQTESLPNHKLELAKSNVPGTEKLFLVNVREGL